MGCVSGYLSIIFLSMWRCETTLTELCLFLFLVLGDISLVLCAAPSWENPRAASHTDSVREDDAGGTNIYTLHANGGDAGLTYSIVSQTPATPVFTIANIVDFQLPKGGVDAETATNFVFVFSVTDGVNSPVKSVNFTLTITDVDEFKPTLSGTPYSATITDDTKLGFSVLTISASDADATPLTYAITGGNTHDTFAIDSRGTVKVKTANLDSSTTPRYNLTITVTDGGSNTLTATAVISVTAVISSTDAITTTGAITTTDAITKNGALTKTAQS